MGRHKDRFRGNTWTGTQMDAFVNMISAMRLYGEVSYAYFNTPKTMPAVGKLHSGTISTESRIRRYDLCSEL